ncbi:helix-turn-helix domain-containing protein [Lentibacillus sediminis]|uniref:helix-turn-helix domain-containing protein n=1 Tax=Lentibacillus sediminis TaxID=1940529 RepID=UPI000C1B8EB9|nr:helix-turn-helix transcriptional regulator [Lentibacillus sediminis]
METVGGKILYYRKKRGFTRSDLVEGICNESTLFRIEKGLGNKTPNMFIIEQLCQKLAIPMPMLFNESKNEKQQSIDSIKQKCRMNVYDKAYNKLKHNLNILNSLVEETESDYYYHRLFITWHEAILLKHNKQPRICF